MPRPARISVAGGCYHVLNRGNGQHEVFHKPEDYEALLRLISDACERLPMRVLAFCLMPNHFHLALQPHGNGDLSRWMQWLTTDHPIDLTRYQVAGCYMGRAGLINSGGALGQNEFADAARTAVVNKRAGGMGLISGRKAFQRPIEEGGKLLNVIQDVYLDRSITVA
ncbi:MAG: transposase [Planctomycetota bacterium]|jgi:DhnA family fructose-bisphosphate aldolase class Ia